MEKIICGIQQIGIGIPNVYEAWEWYRKKFGMDIPIFDDNGTAALMLPYTGNKPQDRHAVLAINMQGGGGFEIWQYVSRIPQPATFKIEIGDLGIFAAKIKTKNVKTAYDTFIKHNGGHISRIDVNPVGQPNFFVKDTYNNHFQIVESDNFFSTTKAATGGAYGAIIGVSDINKSLKLYSDILGFDKIIYDKTGVFTDFAELAGGNEKCRRILLRNSKPRKGAFGKLLGDGCIELVQLTDKKPRKIFENRFWGDLGFIHLCFDVVGMSQLKEECEKAGYPFTVDSSSSFDMGEAAGHFTYIEDNDGTLIEFVETHKLPIFKKIGWYLNLQNRDQSKHLPNWMIKALGINRKK